MGQKADTTIRENIRKIKEQAPTRDSRIRMEAGGVELQSFWRGAYVHRPSSDDLGWVFDPPQMEHWSASKSISKQMSRASSRNTLDRRNSNPTRLYYQRHSCDNVISAVDWDWTDGTSNGRGGTQSCIHHYPILFLIFAVISHFVGASGRVAIEHVTEKVRSVAVGDTELVGQVGTWERYP